MTTSDASDVFRRLSPTPGSARASLAQRSPHRHRRPLHPWPVSVVGGVPVARTTYEDACLFLMAPPRQALPVRLVNAWSIALASEDADYFRTLALPEAVNLPDGKPVAWALRRSPGDEAPGQQVRGPSLFRDVLARSPRGVRHFFIGGTDGSLREMLDQARRANPDLVVAGSIAPPFAPLSQEALTGWAAAVRDSRADIVWIGLGTPKQDFAAEHLAAMTNRPCVGVGAAFDFLAGTQREAPVWVRALALEWLYRLVSEPRRLWRRYLVGNWRFARLALSGGPRT